MSGPRDRNNEQGHSLLHGAARATLAGTLMRKEFDESTQTDEHVDEA